MIYVTHACQLRLNLENGAQKKEEGTIGASHFGEPAGDGAQRTASNAWFASHTRTALELYNEMLAIYPDRVNPAVLWAFGAGGEGANVNPDTRSTAPH